MVFRFSSIGDTYGGHWGSVAYHVLVGFELQMMARMVARLVQTVLLEGNVHQMPFA